MALTELLPVDSTAGSASAERTIADGAAERVAVKTIGTDLDASVSVAIEFKDDAGNFLAGGVLSGLLDYRSRILPGPCTYRLVRLGGTIGAYAEHAAA